MTRMVQVIDPAQSDPAQAMANWARLAALHDDDDPWQRGRNERKRAFLDALATSATIVDACITSGVPERTVFHWRDDDAAFDTAVRAIVSSARRQYHERLEHSVWQRALAGDTLLSMFVLKRLDPSYRDNYKPEPAGHAAHRTAGTAVDTESVSAWQGMLDALGLAGLADDVPEQAMLPQQAGSGTP